MGRAVSKTWSWREPKPRPAAPTVAGRIARAIADDPLLAGWIGEWDAVTLAAVEDISQYRRDKLMALPPYERLDAVSAIIFVQRFEDCSVHDITDLMHGADDEALEAALTNEDERQRLESELGVEELGHAEELRSVYRQKFIEEHWAEVAAVAGLTRTGIQSSGDGKDARRVGEVDRTVVAE
jgi:hypothetical protein